jgi:hypothetical protein
MWDRVTVPVVDGKRAFAALALSLIVACGGAASTTGASPTAAATAAGATSSPAATSSGTPSGTPTATGPRLSDLLTAGRAAQYKITYKYALTGAGGMTGEQSWYFKPPRSRYDFTSTVGGQTTVVSFFNVTDGSFFCMSVGTAKTCFRAAAGMPNPIDSNPAAVFAQGMIANPSAYGGVFVENKTFAGQSGSCYDVTGQSGTGRFCYTQSGILLYQNFTASGSGITLEATNVSTTVPDSDFELPARPSN